MARGPLPDPNAVRKSAPTIPATTLPAEGNPNEAPECPYDLGQMGRKWWNWVWATPESAGWSTGNLYLVARRATLEDKLDVVLDPDYTPLGTVDPSVAIYKEMMSIDVSLGLTPKARADLRWKILPSEPETEVPDQVAARRNKRVAAIDSNVIAK
jgi:hypothetical protein